MKWQCSARKQICWLSLSINYYFGSYKDDFNEPLREIIKTENIEITEDEYNKVYPLIHEFLINFKKLC